MDRANVSTKHRVALIMLKDAAVHAPARIGVLDVGGATLEDVTAWSTWDDPNASRRASTLLQEEETQGNGGKAYMYRLFTGPARILGIRDRRRNCKGFDGEPGTEERGNPGHLRSGRGAAGGQFCDDSIRDTRARRASSCCPSRTWILASGIVGFLLSSLP